MSNENLYQKLDEIIKTRNSLKARLFYKDVRSEYHKFDSVLNYCLKLMKSDYREIIFKSYFDCDYKFWWVDKYCKSSFYRMRIKAICSFVHLFTLIYENFNHFSDNIYSAI